MYMSFIKNLASVVKIYFRVLVREAAKKSSSLNGRAIKMGGGGERGGPFKKKKTFF